MTWVERAGCREMPEFPDLKPAVAVFTCLGCPVRTQCREQALADERDLDLQVVALFPVWGGLSGRERANIIRQQRVAA